MRKVIYISVLAFLTLCLMGCSTVATVDDNPNTTTNDTANQTTDSTHTQQDLQTGSTSKQ